MGKNTNKNSTIHQTSKELVRSDGVVGGVPPATLNDLKKCLDKQRVPRGQPQVVTLGKLREIVGLSQANVAQTLGVVQGNVSKFENRGDMRLSSLRSYLEALGVEAQINVAYKGRSYRLDLGDLDT